MKTGLFVIFCFFANILFAQPVNGITHQPDTSFTTNNAFIAAQKKYPDIRIVEPAHYKNVSQKFNIEYCKDDGRKLFLDVFSPVEKSLKKRVAILILFGGGWRSGTRSQLYPLAQKLASLGYVCVTPDYSLSTDAYYPAAIHDIKTAVKWIKFHHKDFNIDTAKLVALGFSAGGELAAFVGNTNGYTQFDGKNCFNNISSWVHGIIDIDGTLSFVHPESGEGDDSKKTSAATYWLGYAKSDKPELWEEASPLTYTGKNTPATLFINSSISRMHAGRTDYINILKKYGTYYQIKTFDNTPHSFCLFYPWFTPMVKYIDNFLKFVFH